MLHGYYYNDDFEVAVDGDDYKCCVEAKAEAEHTPGTMYKRNGDPGDPPEDYFDVTSCDVTNITDVDDVPVDDQEIVQKVYDKVTDYMLANEDWFDWDGDYLLTNEDWFDWEGDKC